MQRPKTLLASGAGAAAANGLYKEEGLYKGVPKYVHENGQLWVLRYCFGAAATGGTLPTRTSLTSTTATSIASRAPRSCHPSSAHGPKRDGILPGPVLTEVAADGSALELEAGGRRARCETTTRWTPSPRCSAAAATIRACELFARAERVE